MSTKTLSRVVVALGAFASTSASAQDAERTQPGPPGDTEEAGEEEEGDPLEQPALDSFPLSERGVVVGAGLSVHAFDIGSKGLEMEGVATTALTYVGVLPFRWTVGTVTRKYCASYDRSKEANLLAAQETFPDMGIDGLKKKIANEPTSGGPIATATGWDVHRAGKCFPTSIGVFAALPSSFDANVSFDSVTASRSVRPLISFGLLWAATPWLNVLVGATVSHVAVGDEGMERDKRVWSGLFALGTPIDAIGGAFSD